VVGPAGGEIRKDEHGRVKVQFHLDRDDQRDEISSAWVRVAHPAGPNEPALSHIPEIGDQVLVVFEEGVQSRSIIFGRMYNAVDMAPRER
jgi:type VI secretion system secreted protein VgrG